MNTYLALLDKVDRFVADVRVRHGASVACHPGCASCCVEGITVWRVEFDHIHTTLTTRRAGGTAPEAKRCTFLDGQERCTIYDVRPLVCRLWGMPLLFRADDETEIAARSGQQPIHRAPTASGALACCSKNFTEPGALETIGAISIVNMDITLNTLAAINHVYCRAIGADPTQRFALAGAGPPPFSC